MIETEEKRVQADDAVLLTAEDVGHLLQVSERSVWRWLSAGKIPEPVKIGGSTRWRRGDVQEWIERGCPARHNA